MQTKKASIRNLMASFSVNRCSGFSAGIDILDRERIRKAIDDHGDRFLKKIYTSRELENFPEKDELYYSIVFSLKEAFWKTLPEKIQKDVYFNDIEVIWKNKNFEIYLKGEKTKNFQVSYAFNDKIVMTTVIRGSRKK